MVHVSRRSRKAPCLLYIALSGTHVDPSASPSMSLLQWLQESFPPASKWHLEDAPDLTGKVAIVTGGNAGIGREITKGLLKKNARVYIATRSADRAQEAIDTLTKETGNKAEFLPLDLSDLAKVRDSAQAFAK